MWWKVAQSYDGAFMPLFAWTVSLIVIVPVAFLAWRTKHLGWAVDSIARASSILLGLWLVHFAMVYGVIATICTFRWLASLHLTEQQWNQLWYSVIRTSAEMALVSSWLMICMSVLLTMCAMESHAGRCNQR